MPEWAGWAGVIVALLAHGGVGLIWATRIGEGVRSIREDMLPSIQREVHALREARHSHANEIAVMREKLKDGADRMDSHATAIGELRGRVDQISRMDEKLTAMVDRLVRIEHAVDKRNTP